MNNIVRDEIELTDVELAGVYGADDGDADVDPKPALEPEKDADCDKEEREAPCVNIFIICERKHHKF
jgi:hypothetical protein